MDSKVIPLIRPEQKLTLNKILILCKQYGYDPNVIRSFMHVETGGIGYSSFTGKLIIQFEKAWFKKNYKAWKKDTANIVWLNNGIGNQQQEWAAFSAAFKENATAAMLSTSIGIGQVMGFHYLLLGFKTVNEMWDFAKQSEANQLELVLRFISANSKLSKAVKERNWYLIAFCYNGEKFEEQALKNHYLAYDKQMEVHYHKLAA